MCLKLPLLRPLSWGAIPPGLRLVLPPPLWMLALLLALPHPLLPCLLLLALCHLWPKPSALWRPWLRQLPTLRMTRLRWPLPWMSASRRYCPRLKAC